MRRRKVLDADAEEISEQFPDNWEDIQRFLLQDRDYPEPTTSEHRGFRSPLSPVRLRPPEHASCVGGYLQACFRELLRPP